MAKKANTYKAKKKKKGGKESFSKTKINFSFLEDRRFKLSAGLLVLIYSFVLFLALLSFVFTGQSDQSVVESLSFGQLITSGKEVENWLGLFGAWMAHLFIYKWFGIASVLLFPLLFSYGVESVFKKKLLPLKKTFQIVLFMMFWLSLLMGYIVHVSEQPDNMNFLCGGIGLRVAEVFDSLVGWGTIFFLIFSMGVFLIYFVQNTESLKKYWPFKKKETTEVEQEGENEGGTNSFEENGSGQPLVAEDEVGAGTSLVLSTDTSLQPTVPEEKTPAGLDFSVEDKTEFTEAQVEVTNQHQLPQGPPSDAQPGQQLTIEDGDLYDPTLDLARFEAPNLELLNEGGGSKVKVTTEELQQNKDRIVETLNNFKIGIASIKATIGPTVTLYEIVPEAGVKISRIKNLEDDIALSLAALGIRIIAPIPGKGTIGIEVPNKNREMVTIRSILSTEKFQNSKRELPVALGKTISNEVFVADLSKMPHLLMAGATGQGKSVGLNVILASLLYAKHPAEIKFVLIDPKKVELSLFNQIEQHYLASLPDSEEAIITDTKKAVGVLNSLCNEMDIRYNLLKNAQCRNLKEYNSKFRQRKLNPERGHRFLPYIVLVMDELADLMMVAGKEVEMPIARLAQLARAIGIHLVIATQRPSVDVITGIIKANFPARLSFRVSSKVDSRTILDTSGAEQLIGMGDMLLSNGSEIIRLQCAFIDTEEIDRVCEHIGSQQGYDTAYMLPEYETEDEGGSKGFDIHQRDALFEDAARLLVLHQQGSTSLVQRKLSLGYNRAGRIIDQLEAAGIVGPFEGSKARQVLMNEQDLEIFLGSLPGRNG